MKENKLKIILVTSFLLIIISICSSLVVLDVYGADFYTFKNEEQVDISKYPDLVARIPEVTQEMVDNGHLYHICLESYSYGARWRYVTVLSKYPIGLYVSGENLVFGASASIDPNTQYMFALQDVYLDNSSITDALPGFSTTALGFYAQYSIIDKNGCFMSYSDMPISNNLANLRLYLDSNGENTTGLLVQPSEPIVEVEGANNHLYLPQVDFHFVANNNTSFRNSEYNTTTNSIFDNNAYYFPSKKIGYSVGGSVQVTNNSLAYITYQLDDYQSSHLNDFNLNYTIYFSDFVGPMLPNTEKLNYTGQIIDQYNTDNGAIFMQNGKYGSYINLTPILRSDKNYLVVDVWLTDNIGNSSGHFKKLYQRGSDPDGVVSDNSLSVNNNPFFEEDFFNPNNNDSGFGYYPITSGGNSSLTVNVNNNDPNFYYGFDGFGNYTSEELSENLKDMYGVISSNGKKGYIETFFGWFASLGVFGTLLGYSMTTVCIISFVRIILRR